MIHSLHLQDGGPLANYDFRGFIPSGKPICNLQPWFLHRELPYYNWGNPFLCYLETKKSPNKRQLLHHGLMTPAHPGDNFLSLSLPIFSITDLGGRLKLPIRKIGLTIGIFTKVKTILKTYLKLYHLEFCFVVPSQIGSSPQFSRGHHNIISK